jgi:hypothetical protein
MLQVALELDGGLGRKGGGGGGNPWTGGWSNGNTAPLESELSSVKRVSVEIKMQIY